MPFLFPEFKKKAVTFSYDDGVRQDFRLVERFRRFGLRATFNLCSGWFGKVERIDHFGFDVCVDKVHESEAAALYRDFEVASHSVHHPTLTGQEDAFVREEVLSDVKRLEQLFGRTVCGFAYPCGAYDEKLMQQLEACGILYARTIESTGSFAIPENFLAWHPSCHDADDIALQLANQLVTEQPGECRLLYIWGHSFEFDKTDFNRWQHMEQLCETLSGHNDIWYADNAEICRYVMAARTVHYEGSALVNPSDIDICWEEKGKHYLLTAGH